MRIAIPHNLSREDVRSRLQNRIGEIGDHVPGGMASVSAQWAGEDTVTLTISAMGQDMAGSIENEEGQLVFTVDLPAGLGFVRNFIESAIRDKGQKLLN